MTIIERLKTAKGPLTVKQVAEALGCHIMTIYGWADEGKIPHMRIGRRVKFGGATLAVWLEKRTLN